MKSNRRCVVVAGLAAVALIAMGGTGFAGKGMGYRYDGPGYGYAQSRGAWPCSPMFAELTPEQRQQMDQQRHSFFQATQDERRELYAKRLQLKAEMAQTHPDPATASELQQAISALQSSLDRKHLEHILAMRAIHPDAGRGFFQHGRGGRGHMGHGPGMGAYRGWCR